MTAVVGASTTERALDAMFQLLAQLSGLAVLAGTVALVAAFLYRWYVREPIPRGLAVLLGLSAVAAYLNVTSDAMVDLGEIMGGVSDETVARDVLPNIAAFASGLVGANVGRRLGDGFGTDVFDATTFAEVDDGVGRLVKAVGRVITVELPQEVEDVVGYDPVPDATKEELAGRTFLFPRRLTIDELRDRLVARLKTDYAVGHVDVELDEDGSVAYLAVGSRAAGIGPTLPPATNAMAIRADPALAASAGDLVQVWETGPTRRVLTAELRGVAGDVATVAIDAADTPKLDPTTEYRLVTLPVEDRPDGEFVSLLRAADESFASTTVQADSALDGAAVAAVDVVVIAVSPTDGEPDVLPAPDRVLAPGDVVHAIGRPEALRRLETAAAPVADDDAAVTSATAGVAGASRPGPSQGGVTDASGTVDDSTTAQAGTGEAPARDDAERPESGEPDADVPGGADGSDGSDSESGDAPGDSPGAEDGPPGNGASDASGRTGDDQDGETAADGDDDRRPEGE